jgi:hypothetical protein
MKTLLLHSAVSIRRMLNFQFSPSRSWIAKHYSHKKQEQAGDIASAERGPVSNQFSVINFQTIRSKIALVIENRKFNGNWYMSIGNCLRFSLIAFLMACHTTAFAAEADIAIRLRPHCSDAAGGSACSEFLKFNNESFTTNGLKVGDTLDLDIVIQNPSGQPVQSVQSWIEFNSAVLQGTDVRISDTFPLVAPGEQAFAEGGRVKIGASNVSGGVTLSEFAFARVQFKVIAVPANTSLVQFHEFSLLGQEGKTKVLIVEKGRTVNILKKRPKTVRLYFGEDPPPTEVPNQPTPGPTPSPVPGPTPLPTPTPSPTPTPAPTGFMRLQPSGLRVMTEGEQVFLMWNPVTDSALAGYNIYYGTVSGRYIHRRTLSASTTNETISGLPLGQRYFFALTGYDAAGRETEFSFEVAVTVGDPASSTAPFALTTDTGFGSPLLGSVPGSGVSHVPGSTGVPFSSLLGLMAFALVTSALFLRFRRSSHS